MGAADVRPTCFASFSSNSKTSCNMRTRTVLLDLSLTELRQAVHKVYRQGGGSRPDVLLIERGEERAVLKDHGACDPWFARMLGPLLAWREARALKRLHGIQGIPDLLRRPDSRSLLLEYLCATQLSDKKNSNTDWEAFFKRLELLLATMHERGVAHCDLRSPFNTLIDSAGNPVLVDFVASVSCGRPWNLAASWVFRRFAKADKQALVKLKRSVAPALVSEQEYVRYATRSKSEQFMRWVGARVRALSRKLFTRRSD